MKCTGKQWDSCRVEKWDVKAVIMIRKMLKK